jgi:hypothetical protein
LVEPPPAIVAGLEDESAKVRAEAVASLANYTRGLPRLIPSLLDSMHMARPEARANYAARFGNIKPPSFSAAALAEAIRSGAPACRATSIEALTHFGPEAEVDIPTLIAEMKGNSHSRTTGRRLIFSTVAFVRDPV